MEDPAAGRAGGLNEGVRGGGTPGNGPREDGLTIRINEFEATPGGTEELRAFLLSILPLIRNSPGCLSCQLLTRRDNPARFVVIETWETIEAHEASLKSVPPETFQEARALLGAPPTGAYYDLLSG